MVFLTFLRKIYDFVCDYIFSIIYSNVEVKKIPPAKDPLLRETAISLAEKIRNREVTSQKVVETFINRVKEVNGIINSVVNDRFNEAIKEAKAVDQLIESGSFSPNELKQNKPLLGVPFTSKESTAAKGMNWTCGMTCRKGSKATFDAEIVKQMKDAGAILIGVTNVPELNLWIETRNYVYGQTNNPYNTNRIAGGSSGGEASIVSCCGSPIGLGTDIGGSARLPAYFCGVYGHKLTGGLINTRGMTFRTGEEKHTIVSAGAITKYAVDLKPVCNVLVLPEKLPLLNLDSEVNVEKLNFFYVLEPGDRRVSPIGSELNKAMLKVIRMIKENRGNNNPPQKTQFSGFKYSYTLWRFWMSRESNNFAHDITNAQEEANAFVEVPKKIIGRSSYTLAAVLKLVDLHLPLPLSSWAEQETENLKNQIVEKLGDNGVLLFPSYPSTAPYHNLPFLRPYNFAYWAIFNALQLPVTQVPIGLSEDGLPLGIQVVAAPNQDRLCFAVAEYIESLTGGWVPPFSE